MEERERPGVSVERVCHRHASPPGWSPLAGRVRLTARKAATAGDVAIAEDAANELPPLVALRDLMRPLDAMMAIERDDGRCTFAPGSHSPAAAKRRVAAGKSMMIVTPAGVKRNASLLKILFWDGAGAVPRSPNRIDRAQFRGRVWRSPADCHAYLGAARYVDRGHRLACPGTVLAAASRRMKSAELVHQI